MSALETELEFALGGDVDPAVKRVRDTSLSLCAVIVGASTVHVRRTGISVVIVEVSHG